MANEVYNAQLVPCSDGAEASALMLRTDKDIAAEINIIKRRTALTMLESSLEIGRLLCEAKEKVAHGEWIKWLEQNVGYSQSTADNAMRLWKERMSYERLGMFGSDGFEIFEGMTPSQVLALLPLPREDRQQFVEVHNAAEMSVREIKAQVKAERDARELAERQAADAQRRAEQAENAREELEIELALAKEAPVTFAGEERKRIEKEAKAVADVAAEKKIAAVQRKAEKELERARAEGAEAVKRVEAERDAAVQAAREEAAQSARQEAETRIRALEDRLKAVAAVSSPYRVKFGTCFEALQAAYGRLVAVVEVAEREEPEEGALLRSMLAQVVSYLKV